MAWVLTSNNFDVVLAHTLGSLVDTSYDHGAMGGLGDDDHTQYILVDGTRDFTGPIEINAGGANTPLILESTDANCNLILKDSGSTGNSYLTVNADDLFITVDTVCVIRWDADGAGIDVANSDCILDEDAMGSNDPKRLATQQSIKAYVDAIPTLPADPGFDATVLWDDSASTYVSVAPGTGLAITAAPVLELSHLGFEDLTDPGADRIVFWDETYDILAWLVPNLGIKIDGTNLDIDVTDTNWFLDDDTFAANSATHTASQQSIKAYGDVNWSSSSGTPQYFKHNLIVKEGTTDTTQVSVTADELAVTDSSSNTVILSSVSELNITITSAGAGGLDTGYSETTGTWYFIHIIYNSSTLAVDGMFSGSATAPNLPAGYDHFRCVGEIYNNASGNLVPRYRVMDEVFMKNAQICFSSYTTTSSWVSKGSTWASAIPTAVQKLLIHTGTNPSAYGTPNILGVSPEASATYVINPGGGGYATSSYNYRDPDTLLNHTYTFWMPILTAGTFYVSRTGTTNVAYQGLSIRGYSLAR